MAEKQRGPRTVFEALWGAQEFSNDGDTRRVTFFCLTVIGFGVVFVLAHAGLSTSSALWMLGSGAFFAVGMTTGFIFAIPRASHSQVNSNLEQISDWLTKILVGVGLTQLSSIPKELAGLAQFIAGGASSSGTDRSFALFLILYFFFGGFVDGYLVTRVYLTGAFLRSEGRIEREFISSNEADGSPSRLPDTNSN